MRHEDRKPVLAEPNHRRHNWNMIDFRASGQLGEHILVRCAARDRKFMSKVARRDLGRYYALLHSSLARCHFTEPEAITILRMLSTPASSELQPEIFVTYVVGRSQEIVIEPGVDIDELLAKLRPVDLTSALAIIDACQQWWTADWKETHESLVAVGLLHR